MSDHLSFAYYFVLGGLSGAIAKTSTAPFERVKLILQTQDANPLIKSGQVPRYTGIVNCLTRVYQEQGLRSLWRGNFTNVIRYVPTQMYSIFLKNTIINTLFPKYSYKTNFSMFFIVNMASGVASCAASLCFVYPLVYVQTRLASDVGSQQKSFNGLTDCLIKTIKGPSGVSGLYNGFGIYLIGSASFRGGGLIGFYDSLYVMNPFKRDHGIVGLASKFAIAQVSTIVVLFASYPFDTISRRLQMQSMNPKSEWLYRGTIDCFLRIIKEEGATAFYKGAGADFLRAVGYSLTLVVYSEIKNLFGFEGV
eukprot:gene15754-21330_t